ncbi:MAG: hypothetical protein HY960_15585 [Ignavibacteriae bacterium]|nr:hypothetical protein [Ignavibacteriota bacterium]
MSTAEMQKRIKFVNDANGKKTDVIIPYTLFLEFLEMKISMEIYEQDDVQQSLKRAKKQIQDKKTKSFKNVEQAIQWLNQ